MKTIAVRNASHAVVGILKLDEPDNFTGPLDELQRQLDSEI